MKNLKTWILNQQPAVFLRLLRKVHRLGQNLKMDMVGSQRSVPRGSGNAEPPVNEAIAGVSQKLKGILHITPRKPSGAQRRKLSMLKAAEAARSCFRE